MPATPDLSLLSRLAQRGLILLLVLGLGACATMGPLKRSCYHVTERVEKDIGYCQAVRVGDTLHISGTLGRGPMSAAMKEVYDNIDKTLKAHGLSFDNVVVERVYATSLDDFVRNKAIRRSYFGNVFPASTWVQIDKLFLHDIVLEVEITAVYPKKFKIVTVDSW